MYSQPVRLVGGGDTSKKTKAHKDEDAGSNEMPRSRRGFSTTVGNEALVEQVRHNFYFGGKNSMGGLSPFVENSETTIMLPCLLQYPSSMRAFLQNELIESSHLVSLEQSGHLNWWCDLESLQRLWPLCTRGDGNCLLHAASLAMWGVHDGELQLRHSLHHYMWDDISEALLPSKSAPSNSFKSSQSHSSKMKSSLFSSKPPIIENDGGSNPLLHSAFYRRWRWQTQREYSQLGFTLAEEQWSNEWDTLVRLSTPSPKRGGNDGSFQDKQHLSECHHHGNSPQHCCIMAKDNHGGIIFPSAINQCFSLIGSSTTSNSSNVYDSLEQIHIFALAHVLRRPIIVISDTMLKDAEGQPLQPILFGGIYLPLMESPLKCHKDPLLLSYKDAHFSALLAMKSPSNTNIEIDCEEEFQRPLGIPLIDPKTQNLLPIHFAVDPGSDWQWNKDCMDEKKVKKLLLNDTELHCLLEQYMQCVYVPIQRRLSSIAESGTSLSSLEDSVSPREDGESVLKVSQAAKKLNHIGKSLGRHIKKAVTRPLEKSGAGKLFLSRSTQSTSFHSDLSHLDQECIFVALFEPKLPPNYQKMMDNYLHDAEDRFNHHNRQQRRNSQEIVRRVQEMHSSKASPVGASASYHSLSSSTENSNITDNKCKRLGCSMYGTPKNDYMCSKCYKESQESDNRVRQINIGRDERQQNYSSQLPRQHIQNVTVGHEREPSTSFKSHRMDIERQVEQDYENVRNRGLMPLSSVSKTPSTLSYQTNYSTRIEEPRYTKTLPPIQSDPFQHLSLIHHSRCRTSGCSNYATVSEQGYCLSCASNSRPCETEGCLNRVPYAKLGRYCNVCSSQYQSSIPRTISYQPTSSRPAYTSSSNISPHNPYATEASSRKPHPSF